MKRYILFSTVISLFFALTFFRIDQIPGEWYGDISIVHEYTSRVISGKWPIYFEAGGGPLYHYLIAPIISVLGTQFVDYKIASIIIGILGLASIYLVSKELSSVKIGLLSTAIAIVSFWYFMWSRSGNYNILMPVLSSMVVYFTIRYIRYRNLRDLFLGGIISSTGLLYYPAAFTLPLIYLILLAYGCFAEKRIKSFLKISVIASCSFLPVLSLFLIIVSRQPGHFTEGYIGSKLFNIKHLSNNEITSRFITNIYRTMAMFHLEGDSTFRYNVPKSPHLDVVSGTFFLFGFIYWASGKRRKNFGYILIPIILLSLPSLSPGISPAEIPNIARTFAIFPFVALLISSGVLFVYQQLVKFNNTFSVVIFYPIFIVVVYLNLNKYFIYYPVGLPDKNLAPGKIIANYIDKLPSNVSLYFSSCCWGEWGEPEPKGVAYQLRSQKRFTDFSKLVETCDEILHRPAVVVIAPGKKDLVDKFMKCQIHSKVLDIKKEDNILISNLVLLP